MKHGFYFRFFKVFHNETFCALLSNLAYFLYCIKYKLAKLKTKSNIIDMTVKNVIIIAVTLVANPSIPSVKFIAFVIASITNIANGTYTHTGNSIYTLKNGMYVAVPIFSTFNK